MNKGLWWGLAAAILCYPLATWLVLNFYPDDPSKMEWTDREAFNHKFISQLSGTIPLNQTTVLNKLGGPDITEAVKIGNDVYQLLFYRTKRAISDGITTKQECSALLFKNQQLIALEQQAIEQYQQVAEPHA